MCMLCRIYLLLSYICDRIVTGEEVKDGMWKDAKVRPSHVLIESVVHVNVVRPSYGIQDRQRSIEIALHMLIVRFATVFFNHDVSLSSSTQLLSQSRV